MPTPNANQETGNLPDEKTSCFSPLGLAGLVVALSPAVAGAFPMFGYMHNAWLQVGMAGVAAWALWPNARQGPPTLHLTAAAAGLLAIAAAAYLSVAWATNTYLAGMAALHWQTVLICFLVVYSQIKEERQVRRLLGILVLSLFFVSGLGIAQALFEVDWVPQNGWYAASSFGNANMAAQFVVLLWPVTLGLLLVSSPRREGWVLGLILLASLGYLLQTRTRAALLASLVMLIAWGFVAAYFRKAGTGKAIGGRLLGVGLALVLGASIAALSADEFGKGLYESIGKKIERVDLRDGIQKAGGIRISWFANTTRMISDAMPFGVGGGNWQVHYPAYQNAMLPDKLHGETYKTPQNAHNDVLQLAAEYGLVGVLGLGLIALSLLSALRGLGGRSFSVAILQSSAAIGLLGISVNMQFSFPLQRTVASCTAACLLAVALWPAARGRSITVPRKIAQLASAFFLFLALALAAYHFVGYEAWGHNRIADSLLRDGQYRAKVENLEILIERHPKRVGYQTQKKRYLELLEDLKGYTAESERRLALEHIDAAINLDPYNPAHRIRRLLVLDRLEEWEDLSAEAENLLVVYPYRRSVLMGAVKAYLELGQPERALPHALRLAAIAPMGFSGNETLGTVYAHLGRPETACIHYRRAIKNDPEHRSAEALAGYCEE